MPSSLTVVDPIASVCSTDPPVSVCGTGGRGLLRGFSRERGVTRFGLRLRPPPQAAWHPDLPGCRPKRHRGDVQNPVELPSSVAPSSTPRGRRLNVCRLCFAYASRPRLSPRLTLGRRALPRKPRVLGGGDPRPALATHASILTPLRSTGGRPSRFAPQGKLPYRRTMFAPPLRYRA